jgi:hypothetical protein
MKDLVMFYSEGQKKKNPEILICRSHIEEPNTLSYGFVNSSKGEMQEKSAAFLSVLLF